MILAMKAFAEVDSVYNKALEKAKDLNMSLDGNPLRSSPAATEDLVQENNMAKLRRDACAWNDPRTGEIYRALRSMIFRKEI